MHVKMVLPLHPFDPPPLLASALHHYTITDDGSTWAGHICDYSNINFRGSLYNHRAVWNLTTYDGAAYILHDSFFNDGDPFINIVVTITALKNISDVYYGRETDPDIDYYTYTTYSTYNQLGGGNITASQLVIATGPGTGNALVSKFNQFVSYAGALLL